MKDFTNLTTNEDKVIKGECNMGKNTTILKLLASDGFITVNKHLIRVLGLEEAVLIGELASKYNYYENNNMLTPDGFFFATAEDIEHNTGLSAHKQRKAFNNLEEKGLLETKFKGIPPKKYFKLNTEELYSHLLKSLTVNY